VRLLFDRKTNDKKINEINISLLLVGLSRIGNGVFESFVNKK
jgi:hypothetical protein